MDYREVRVESPLTKVLYAKADQAHIPLSGTFELSPVCNLSCRMCYVRKTQAEVNAHNRPIMKLEEWIELAEEMKKQGTLFLLLTGGEPFLWPDFWTLYEKLHQMGFLLSINSNGSMIDENAIEKLKEMPPVRINITLYGANDDTYYRLCGVHGVYERVIKAIEGLKDAGIQVKLNGSITPDNACDVDAIVDFAKEHELILTATTYMFPPIRRDRNMVGRNERFNPREAAEYKLQIYRRLYGEDTYKKYLQNVLANLEDPIGLEENCIDPGDGHIRCRAGSSTFWVTWDGYFSLCGMIPDFRVDLRKTSFTDCWDELGRMHQEIHLPHSCMTCKSGMICHSCAAMSIAENGTTEKIPKYLCETVYYMKKIAQEEMFESAEDSLLQSKYTTQE